MKADEEGMSDAQYKGLLRDIIDQLSSIGKAQGDEREKRIRELIELYEKKLSD